LGTADDAAGGVVTLANGLYQFSGLPAGSYIVKVAPTGYRSTLDSADTPTPNSNVNNIDNGLGTTSGITSSNIVTLTPGSLGVSSNNTVINATGTTKDPTVDFGYVTSFGKTIVSTDTAHTTGANVTIGEIITYEVSMVIPAGGLNNVQLVDTPQVGLAFVDCVDIDLPTGVTSTNFIKGNCNTKDGSISGTSYPLITGNGGIATFNFGNIENISGSSQTVKVKYSLIVLDILANQDRGNLTNNATWNWTGGTRTTSAPLVQIVEPKLTIDKNATPTSVVIGDIITFTIDIAHSAQSSADAFDVVVADQIPAGLALVTSSVAVTGTASLTSSTYDPSTNIIRLVWDGFGLSQTARVTFQTTFVGPSPVVNSANVEWTTLEIDPAGTPPIPQQRSPYTTDSTERWYDPASPAGVNGYGVSDAITISSPSSAQGGGEDESSSDQKSKLPRTGFTPGIVSPLPVKGINYSNLGDIQLVINSLGVEIPIVGVPEVKNGWDVSWLGNDAGWLNGTAFPTLNGNSVITGHVYDVNGKPGPFIKLNTMKYGDVVTIRAYGLKYTFEVREVLSIAPDDIPAALKHQEKPWITLLTCQGYNEKDKSYSSRVIVRAVMTKVE